MPDRRSGRSAPPPLFDILLFTLAVVGAVVVVPLSGWSTIDWTPLAVIALAILPVVIRFGMVLESQAGTLGVSTAPAMLFAYDIGGPLTFMLPWCAVVLASYLIFFGPARGLGRGSSEVIGGVAMLAAARQVDTVLFPLDRAIVATAVYLLVVLLLELARFGVLDLRRSLAGVRPFEVLLISGGLTLGGTLVVLLREAYDHAPRAATGLTAGACLVVFVVAQILLSRLQSMMRASEVLSRAGAAMPWPSEKINAMLVGFVHDGVRANRVFLAPAEVGAGPVLRVSMSERGDLVATRTRGDYPFTRGDRRLMAALTGMADASRAHALQEQQLRHQATTDALTGLHNYAHFRQRIDRLASSRSPESQLVVFFVDLDGFKTLNSTIGHLETDGVLKGIADRIASLPEEVETCRFGGDEFVFLSTGIDDDMAVQSLAARIREAIESPLEVGDQLVQVRASLGSSLSGDAEEDLDAVIARAEVRMRGAKRERQNPLLKSRADVISELLGPEGFTIAYQPLVSVQDGELHGVEALIRVADKTFGQLSPLLVVDAAIRDDLIDELTERLAIQATQVVAQLAEVLGRRIALNVNVEFAQLRESPLMDTFVALAATEGVGLVLELSERAFDAWTPAHARLATRLRDAGISLAVDDFGAGYATFSMLNQWQWDLVKVDKSLVAGRNPSERRLFTHVASMLDDLGKATMAEGIETYEQLVLVAQLGIEWAQGWWICPPLAAEALLAHAATSSRFAIFDQAHASG